MDLALQPGAPLADGLRRVALSELDRAIEHLSTQQPDPKTAVHEARKSGKRIRAVLRLVRDEIGETLYKQENARVRDAARVLAPVRDSIVMVEALDALLTPSETETAPSLDNGDYAALRQRLGTRHERLSRRIVHDPAVLTGVTAALQDVRAQTAVWPLQIYDFCHIQSGLRRVYRRGRRRMARAYANPHPERFHAWRKCVKYLWHQLEIFIPIQPALLIPMTEALHTLSSHLGDDHDLAELARLIVEESDLLPEPAQRQPLLDLIAERRRRLQAQAAPLGAQLFAARPDAFAQQIADLWHDWQQPA